MRLADRIVGSVVTTGIIVGFWYGSFWAGGSDFDGAAIAGSIIFASVFLACLWFWWLAVTKREGEE